MEKKKGGKEGGIERGREKGKKEGESEGGECTRSCRLSQVETVCGEEPFEQKINL